MHSIIKKLRFLCEIDQKVPIFVEKLKEMQPPKLTFRSQQEPLIKSYECLGKLLHKTLTFRSLYSGFPWTRLVNSPYESSKNPYTETVIFPRRRRKIA